MASEEQPPPSGNGHLKDDTKKQPSSISPKLPSQANEAAMFSPPNSRKKWPVQRSASTPNVRSIASGDMSKLSSAEKRRNKLGYHRTAVACGHCRKRKIRCVMAADDPGARCQNCIRLKKDCHFYPVDHPPSFGKKIKSGHNLDAPSTDAETSGSQSSPGTATGTIDPLDDAAFPHLDAQSQDEPFFPTGPMITPTEKDFTAVGRQDPSPGFQSQTSWQSAPFPGESPHPQDGQQFEGAWTSPDGNYGGPFLIDPASMTFSPHENTTDYNRQYHWASSEPHLRSMSVGGPGDPQNFTHLAPPDMYPPLRRSFTYHPESTPTTHSFHSFPAPSLSQTLPSQGTSAFTDAVSSSHMFQPGFIPSWNLGSVGGPASFHGSAMDPNTSSWYDPSQGLPEVREEEYHHQTHPP